MITKSECKLDTFNQCPGTQEFLKAVKQLNLKLEFVDLEEVKYWKNDDATAVFKIESATLESWGEFIFMMAPDEYHTRHDGTIRLWWD